MGGYGGDAYGTGPYGGGRRSPTSDETTSEPDATEAPRSLAESAPAADNVVVRPLAATIEARGNVAATFTASGAGEVIYPDTFVALVERQGIEVILGDLWRYIADGDHGLDPGHVAQARAVAETLETQSKAPEPSRKVIGWALGQLNSFPGGFLSSVAASYLPQLLHAMHV